MKNLQELYDFYVKTKPSAGKVRSATTLLIHICNALNTDAPEEVTPDMYNTIPKALDDYYGSGVHTALQDKSSLAEMIGRYGPRDGWETVIDELLNDRDRNIRQFMLQSLEYSGNHEPSLVLPYIFRFRDSKDQDMREVSIKLMCRFLMSEHQPMLLDEIQTWSMAENRHYLADIRDHIKLSNDSPEKARLMTWFDRKL